MAHPPLVTATFLLAVLGAAWPTTNWMVGSRVAAASSSVVSLLSPSSSTAPSAQQQPPPPPPPPPHLLRHVHAQYPASENASSRLRLSHLALDRSTGRVYVAGVNHLIQLNAALREEVVVATGPRADSPYCHASGCNSPEIETSLTDNVNKVLVLDPESRTLIACGSLSQGACEKYSLSNISMSPQFVPESIAANDDTSSTYAFIGPEHYNTRSLSNVLYVGTTFTTKGEYRDEVPAISSRKLDNLEFAECSFSKQSLLRIDVKYRDHFLVKYVYGFNASEFAYFVIVQKQSHLPGQEELGYVTRLARTCINDANYDSYTEVTLQCVSRDGNINYNLIQDAKVTRAGTDLGLSLGLEREEPVLVGVFGPSRGITSESQASSAMCVYSLRDIEAKFNENIHMCFNGSIKYRNMGYISGPILDGKCPMAGVS
jgi:plexin A